MVKFFFFYLRNMIVISSELALVITVDNWIIMSFCLFIIQGPRRTMHHMIDLFSYPEMVLLSNVTEVKIKNCICKLTNNYLLCYSLIKLILISLYSVVQLQIHKYDWLAHW